MADVFISYSKADREIAQSLADDLTAAGFDVWWDFQLYAGDDFHDMIRAEIARAKAVVVVWSDTAVASRWVRGEADEAAHLGTMISTFVPGFDPRRVPLNFLALHCEPVGNRDRVIGAIERKGAERRVGLSPVPITAATSSAAQNAGLASEEQRKKRASDLYAIAQAAEAAKRDAQAVRLYREAAYLGDAGSQAQLGYLYDVGLCGLAKDEREAARLYKLAAEQGNALGQNNLGFFYGNGRGGLPKNEGEAARLYKLSADQGNALGQGNLGFLYENGQGGLPKDEREAARYYKLAADQGNVIAREALERLTKKGR